MMRLPIIILALLLALMTGYALRGWINYPELPQRVVIQRQIQWEPLPADADSFCYSHHDSVYGGR